MNLKKLTRKRVSDSKQMDTDLQISYLKKAYNLGKKHAQNGDWSDWYTPRLKMAYDCGYDGIGIDFDNPVYGYRYGNTPTSTSYNYLDNYLEYGVSLAALETYDKETSTSIFFHDRNKVEVYGLLLDKKGSDGEPLVIPLDMTEQFDFD